MHLSQYFCPDCGWEGNEAICPICNSHAESLDEPDDTKDDEGEEDTDYLEDPPLDEF